MTFLRFGEDGLTDLSRSLSKRSNLSNRSSNLRNLAYRKKIPSAFPKTHLEYQYKICKTQCQPSYILSNTNGDLIPNQLIDPSYGIKGIKSLKLIKHLNLKKTRSNFNIGLKTFLFG